MNTDAVGATPEPGTTPEPDGAGDDKGDALAALLAAGAEDLSEPENDGEGSKGAKRSRLASEERRQEEDAAGDYSNCRPLHTRPNALLAAAAASADAEAAPGADWRKHHVLYGNDNHYMFFRCVCVLLTARVCRLGSMLVHATPWQRVLCWHFPARLVLHVH